MEQFVLWILGEQLTQPWHVADGVVRAINDPHLQYQGAYARMHLATGIGSRHRALWFSTHPYPAFSRLRGHVRLMCNSAALTDWLPDRLAAFLREHPGMSVDLVERLNQEIADALRYGACDISVLVDSVDATGLQVSVLGADPLLLVAARDHTLARTVRVPYAEALTHQLVGMSLGGALDDHLAGHARRLGLRPRYRIWMRSFEAICRMVGQGVGVGVVPQSAAVRCGRTSGVKAVRLEDAWATR